MKLSYLILIKNINLSLLINFFYGIYSKYDLMKKKKFILA